MVFDGSGNVFCRMYKNLNGVIKGFSRFIFAAFDFNVFIEAIAIIFVSLLFLVPFILLPLEIFIFDWSRLVIALNIVQIFIILLIKIILAIRFKYRGIDVLLVPVSLIYIVILACNSYLQAKISKGINWKDRVYNIRGGEDNTEPTEDGLLEDNNFKKNTV
jgi:chlorobactene glucosyltransferase